MGGRGGPEKKTWTDLDLGSGQIERSATRRRDSCFLLSWIWLVPDQGSKSVQSSHGWNPEEAPQERQERAAVPVEKRILMRTK